MKARALKKAGKYSFGVWLLTTGISLVAKGSAQEPERVVIGAILILVGYGAMYWGGTD